jgi:hypothetical protein
VILRHKEIRVWRYVVKRARSDDLAYLSAEWGCVNLVYAILFRFPPLKWRLQNGQQEILTELFVARSMSCSEDRFFSPYILRLRNVTYLFLKFLIVKSDVLKVVSPNVTIYKNVTTVLIEDWWSCPTAGIGTSQWCLNSIFCNQRANGRIQI